MIESWCSKLAIARGNLTSGQKNIQKLERNVFFFAGRQIKVSVLPPSLERQKMKIDGKPIHENNLHVTFFVQIEIITRKRSSSEMI